MVSGYPMAALFWDLSRSRSYAIGMNTRACEVIVTGPEPDSFITATLVISVLSQTDVTRCSELVEEPL